MKTKRFAALLMVGLLILMMLCLGTNVYAAAQNTTKTNITKLVEKAEGKIYLTWSKKNVDGYQVRWAPNSKLTGAKTASFTETEMYRSGLIGGKTYYFQVRTYKKTNGKKVYSNWSMMRSVKLKKLPPTTTITSLTANSSSKFTVKWTKKNVKGYQIRYSTDSSFKTKKTASTNGTSITRSNLAKGIYYVSVRTYNIASDGTKYYSNWSGMKRVSLTAANDKKKAYAAYASLVKQYESRYGSALYITLMRGMSYPHCEGLFFLDVIDFDKNGIEELVIGYGMNQGPWSALDIYTYDNNTGATKIVYSDNSRNSSDCRFHICFTLDAYYFAFYHYTNQSYLCTGIGYDYYLKGYNNKARFGTVYSIKIPEKTVSECRILDDVFMPVKFSIGYPVSYETYCVYGETVKDVQLIKNKVSETKKKLGL